MFNEKKFENYFQNLNSDLLNQTSNKYDIRTFSGVLKNVNIAWGITDIIQSINYESKSSYRAFIPDSTRENFKGLLELVKDNPTALAKTESLLKREILYMGSECEKFGLIGVKEEFEKLDKLLTSRYLFLAKVERPTYSSLMDTWDKVKPKIIFISCHGTKYGLIFKDENNECKEHTNSDFFEFFRLRSEYTECVILSACESLNLGNVIAEDGNNVVCINNKVEIKTASKYTHEFFKYINSHSLDNSEIYQNAHDFSIEKVKAEGLKDSFSFEFIKAKKKILK